MDINDEHLRKTKDIMVEATMFSTITGLCPATFLEREVPGISHDTGHILYLCFLAGMDAAEDTIQELTLSQN